MNNNKIKLGICQWAMPIEGPGCIKLAANLGFEGVELEMVKPERDFPLSKKFVQDIYLEEKTKYGVYFPSIAINILDFYCMTGPADLVETKIALAAIDKAIDSAIYMGIPIVQIPCFNKNEIHGKNFKKAVEIFKNACTKAEDHNITIGFESILSLNDICRMLDAVDKKNFKVYFDTQNHFAFRGYEIAELLERLFTYICEIHVKDGKKDQISSSILGEGDSNFYKTMEVIKKYKYEGWLLLENYYDQEPLSLKNKNSLELIQKDLNILKGTII